MYTKFDLACPYFRAHHKTKVTRSHKTAPFKEIREGKYDLDIRQYQRIRCPRHKDDKLTMYCVKCDLLVCRECKIRYCQFLVVVTNSCHHSCWMLFAGHTTVIYLVNCLGRLNFLRTKRSIINMIICCFRDHEKHNVMNV